MARTLSGRTQPGGRGDGRAPSRSRYLAIYAAVRRIPRGSVATYGEVARLSGLAGQARLAGYALHALPAGSGVPWHRVVGSGGRLTLARLDPDAAWRQRLLLEGEGVRFEASGRVDLAKHSLAGRVRRRGAASKRARG